MSNSAFTPTTTQVTTEVPVDVPIVTAWQAYTAVYSGITATGTTYYKRNGDSIEVEGFFDCTAVVNTPLKINLPSGLTIDSSKITSTNKNILGNFAVSTSAGGGGLYASNASGFIVYDSSDNSAIFFALTSASDASGNVVGSSITGSALLNATGQGTFRFTAPIAEWSSGVTTLADRALEEYASNTASVGGTTTDDTTSFAYGPSGSTILAITAQLDRTVRFQTPILATDSLILEIKDDSTGNWTNAAGGLGGNPLYLTRQGTTYYGMGISTVGSTDVVVRFGQYWFPNSATYAQPGQPWSSLANYRWRIRKVSSGAQVGYPISTKNIVGATDGVAPVTGMLGERLSATNTSFSPLGAPASGIYVDVTNCFVDITAGTWLITQAASVQVVFSGTGEVITKARIYNSTDATTLLETAGGYAASTGAATTAWSPHSASQVVTVSSTKRIYMQIAWQSNGGSPSVSALYSRGDRATVTIQAIRIA